MALVHRAGAVLAAGPLRRCSADVPDASAEPRASPLGHGLENCSWMA